MRRLLLTLLMLLALVSQGWAQEIHTLNPKALEKAGAELTTFSIVHVSDDGRQVLAYDIPNVLLKKKGQKVRIWLLSFDSAFNLREARSYPLDIPGLEQVNWSADGKSIVIVTRQGADFLKLDPASGQLSPILTHVKGQPGFRCEPQVVNFCDGKLLAVGYFYDDKDNGQQVTLAEIDANKTGVAAFTPALTNTSIDELESKVPNLYASVTLSPRALFFLNKVDNQMVINLWTPQQGLHEVDRGADVRGLWGEQGRVVYSLVKASGPSELVMFDGITGTRQVLGTTEQALQNLSMARYGQSVAGFSKLPKDMEVLAARDKDNFQLKTVVKQQPLSVIRFSPNGEVLALFNPVSGLSLVKLP